MERKKYVMGVDCGTTSSKTVIFDLEGNQIGTGSQDNPLTYPGVGRVECDGNGLVDTLYATTRKAIADSGIDPADILAVSFCMFRCTMVTRDKDGGFTTPIIIWQDLRSAEMLPWMEQKLIENGMTPNGLYDICGMPLGGVNPSGKLYWVKKHMPEAYENAVRIHTIMGLMTKAYGAEDYYDDINDTPWMQINNEDFSYSPKLAEIFGVDINKYAPLRKSGEIIGKVTAEVAAKTGLKEGTPLVMGTGDQQAGFIGVGCTDEGIGYACGGTAGITAGKSNQILRDPDKKCYVLGTPDGAWVMEGQANSAGSAFRWLKETVCDSEIMTAKYTGYNVYDLMTRAAEKSTVGANGCLFLPYLQGANTPNYDANARGTLVGMTLSHTKNDIIRAMMEGIVFDLRDMIEAMLKAKVPPFTTIRITGGIARSRFWNQMQADIYGKPVETVAIEEATALGCAMIAAVGVGAFSSYQEAAKKMVKITERYLPKPENVEAYNEVYRAWRACFQGLTKEVYPLIAAFQERYKF